jgi:serine/threonine-protein kinase RsbT
VTNPTRTFHEIRVPIDSDVDVVAARQKGRELAHELGFDGIDLALIATAISELARNIVLYARIGDIKIRSEVGCAQAIVVIASDEGPGIADVDKAMRDGFSTCGGLGLGLPGVRRLMDEFEIASEPGRGTTVTVKKWKR